MKTPLNLPRKIFLDLYSPITRENISMPDKSVNPSMCGSTLFLSRSKIPIQNPNYIPVNNHVHKTSVISVLETIPHQI